MDPHRAPRDGDRDRLAERINRAHEQGRIGTVDRDIRLQNVRTAGTMTELEIMARNLDQLDATAPTPSVLQRVATPTASSPTTGPWDRFDPSARTPRALSARSTRSIVVLAVVAVVVVVLGFGVFAFVVMVRSITDVVGDSRSSSSSDAFDEAGTPTEGQAAPSDEVHYALTVPGLRAFVAAYQDNFGSTEVVDLVLYDEYAVVRAPVAGSDGVRGWLLRKDGWTSFGPETNRFPGAAEVDLRRLDTRQLVDNIGWARGNLGVVDPATTWVIVRHLPRILDQPLVDIHVSNRSNQSGYLQSTLDGRVTRQFPYGG